MNTNNIDKNKKKNFFFNIIKHFSKAPSQNQKNLLNLINNLETTKKINKNISQMIKGVMSISKKRIKEIMTPRPKIIFLNINDTIEKCLNIIKISSHSRFPVLNKNKSYVKGILIAKDILSLTKEQIEFKGIQKILRPIIIVPETKYADDMLKEFQLKQYHMAIVIDEFGIISGLITLEDILELIVGKIEDEFDHTADYNQNIQKIDQKNYKINGFTPIIQFNDIFEFQLNDTEVDTIGGFLLKKFGKIPKKNEKLYIYPYFFTISAVNNKRIIQINLKILEKP